MSNDTTQRLDWFRINLPTVQEGQPGQAPAQVLVTSFGYLHDNGVPATIADDDPEFIVDVRGLFRDPHRDPAFRQLTGHDDAIRTRVLAQPGAIEFVQSQAATLAALVPGSDHAAAPKVLHFAIGCAGGRHRSVVLAEAIALVLNQLGIGTLVKHEHIDLPVVAR